jgi:hypothetical protein
MLNSSEHKCKREKVRRNGRYILTVVRIHMFFGLPDPDPLGRGMDPDPALDPDPSIIMQK